MYSVHFVQLEVKLVDMYEDKYKRYYAKKLNEAREKRWEKLERRRKFCTARLIIVDYCGPSSEIQIFYYVGK